MARPKTVTDEQILSAAQQYFVLNGHNASINALATSLGVSHAALFQRFGSKKSLLIAALIPPTVFPWSVILKEPIQSENVLTQLSKICEAMECFFLTHAPRIRVLLSAGLDPVEIFQGGPPPMFIASKELGMWIKKVEEIGIFKVHDIPAMSAGIVSAIFGRAQMKHFWIQQRNQTLVNQQSITESSNDALVADDALVPKDALVTDDTFVLDDILGTINGLVHTWGQGLLIRPLNGGRLHE